MHWYESIEKTLVPAMTDTVRPICPDLVHVELSVANQGIRVVTRGRTARDLRRAIESEVERVGRSEFRSVASWPVVVSSPELIPYTHHLELRSPVYCPN